MATAGDYIKKANFTTSATRDTWYDWHSNKNQHRYLYMCAPAWKIHTAASWWAFGNSGIVQYRFRYFNGTEWVTWKSFECNATGGEAYHYFAYNINDGYGKNGVFTDAGYPLWEVEYWPSRGNDHWSLYITPYTWGSVTDSANYPIGKKIYSIGRSSDCLHHTFTKGDCPFGYPNARTGSPLLASNEKELVSYRWLWN